MSFRFSFLLKSLGLFSVMHSAYAVERISLEHALPRERQEVEHWMLRGTLSSSLSSPDQLRPLMTTRDLHQQTHLRMQQEYEGFTVLGGYAIVHQTPHHGVALNATHMSGAVYLGLRDELGQPASAFVEHASVALSSFKATLPHVEIIDEHVTPIVYVDDKQHAHWAYRVSVLLQPPHAMLMRPTAIVNAETYKPYKTWNDLKTIRSSVQAFGYGGNESIGQYQFGDIFPALNILRDDFTEICYMENKGVRVIDMDFNYDKVNDTMSFDCPTRNELKSGIYWTGYNQDGYDLVNGGYSPSNDALYIGEMIKKMYKEWYGVDVLTSSLTHKPIPLVMRVHYGSSYGNAFWDGRYMTFGDGRLDMHPLVLLDVGAHEVSHGFTEEHAGLEYYDQSGGMNEAFSDMAGQAMEYFVTGKNSWQIGATLFKKNSGSHALRYLDEPSRDGRSIDSAEQYKLGMDVHHSSGVYNRLFYLLSTHEGWDPRKAFAVMVHANMDYWTPTSTFEEGSCGILEATHDLDYSVEDVEHVLSQVGLFCERV